MVWDWDQWGRSKVSAGPEPRNGVESVISLGARPEPRSRVEEINRDGLEKAQHPGRDRGWAGESIELTEPRSRAEPGSKA